jgi:phosphoribosylformylglycinamidine synthase
VAEAARNCVVTGARPLALTNCLNFGNPEKPSAYYQMERAIDGMAEAARLLETPVISGNVSLYNESFGQGIFPTPVVGMVGLIEGRLPTPSAWSRAGDVVALLGDWNAHSGDLGGSAYLATLHATVAGHPPLLDLDRERAVQQLTLAGIERELIRSAHDCSDGGLAVALAECAIWSGLGLRGAETALPGAAAGADGDALATIAALYGEAPSRIVVSVAPEQYEALAALAAQHETPITRLGEVGGERLSFTSALDVAIAELRATWRNGLRVALGADDAEQVAETFAAD